MNPGALRKRGRAERPGAPHARRPRRKPAPAAPTIDVVIDSPLWQAGPDAETWVRRAVTEAAAASTRAGELAILLTDDSAVRALNRDWRGKDVATNVLSFPLPVAGGGGDDIAVLLGDIVIAFETTAREAAAENKPFGHHLAHLAVHGFLHLVGYDHETDQEADAMEQLETMILARLGIPDPYIPRAAGT
jgi:probable rRNA maturation factor